MTVFIIYILIGALIVLPATDDLNFTQIISIVLTWPVVVFFSIRNHIKKEN